GAAGRTAASLGLDEAPGTPLLVGSMLGMGLLAAGALAIAALGQRARTAAATVADWESAGQAAALGFGAAALAAIAWTALTPPWACVASSALALAAALLPRAWRAPALPAAIAGLQALALAGFVGSLHLVHGTAMLSSGWQGLVAATLIGASLLATAGLMLPPDLRERIRRMGDDTAPASAWPLGATLGLLAGLGAISLAVLFVLPADQAARVWPWLGVAAWWFGLRLRHDALAAAGVALQVVAGVANLGYGPALWTPETTGLTLWTPLMLTLAGLLSGDAARKAALRSDAASWLQQPAMHWGLVVWALLWWAQVLPPEVYRGLRRALDDWPAWWAVAIGAWVLLSSVLVALGARWRDWLQLGQSSWVTLPGWALAAWLGVALIGDAPHGHGGWALWPLALAWHAVLLRWQARWGGPRALVPLHVAGFWLFVLLAARECQGWFSGGAAEPATAWSALGWVLVPAVVLAVVTRPGVLRRWPFAAFRDAYLLAACGPVAAYLLLWVWLSNALAGDAAPLPFVPLLNPLELGHALVLLSLLLWFRALPDSARRLLPQPLLLGGLGVTAFALYTGLLLRACHHLAGVPWEASALFASTLTQATLSVAWAILGVGLMVTGHRTARRIVWGVGAGLLALVVLKLFFVELADHGGLYRIVSFIVVGLLMLLVGYFAPVPPRREAAASEVAP
ncbi:MAG TPA: DUF2339 domain-containing protein, partial [Ideonella sp.]|nr:DUF2339 domain-containing protein [Ideonella sp.]